MPLRRILVVLLLFMVTMSIAASLTTRTDDSATVPRRVTPAQAGTVRTVTATLPKARVVHAASGDRIVLEVVADAEDQIQIEGYDLFAPVDPETPAQFDFIAGQAGRFRVSLNSTGKVLGRVQVVERP